MTNVTSLSMEDEFQGYFDENGEWVPMPEEFAEPEPEPEPVAMVGQPAPDFTGKAVLPNLEFKDISLSNYRRKWVVLFTFPLDFTFVCPTEIVAFSDKYESFKKLNCEVIGLSVDSVYSHLAWVETERKEGGIGHLKFPIVGDLGAQIARKYGFYMDEAGYDMRGTVIINPDGVVVHMSMNHPEVGRNIDEVLRLLEAFQFTRKHGVVCPAQWEKGYETIVPTVKGSQKYFEKAEEKQSFLFEAEPKFPTALVVVSACAAVVAVVAGVLLFRRKR